MTILVKLGSSHTRRASGHKYKEIEQLTMSFASAGAGLKSVCVLTVGDKPRFTLHSFGLSSTFEFSFADCYYSLSWTGRFSHKGYRSQKQRKEISLTMSFAGTGSLI